MDNRHIKLLLPILILIASISPILALGINSPYWKDNPLKMYPGETKNVEFTLENSISEREDAKAIVLLTESAGIAEIVGEKEFTISPGSKDNKIVIKISIPEEADIGKIYTIKFSVRKAEQEKEGMVQVNIGYDLEFPVIIATESEVPKEISAETESGAAPNITAISITAAIILIIIIGAIGYFIYRKARLKNEFKRPSI